jgi:hypothetical protein
VVLQQRVRVRLQHGRVQGQACIAIGIGIGGCMPGLRLRACQTASAAWRADVRARTGAAVAVQRQFQPELLLCRDATAAASGGVANRRRSRRRLKPERVVAVNGVRVRRSDRL